jgi:predicted dehydrogenase
MGLAILSRSLGEVAAGTASFFSIALSLASRLVTLAYIMANRTYRAGIIGLGFIGGADQVSGDALGQRVADLDGTHLTALSSNARIDLVAGSSRDAGRRQRFEQRTGRPTYASWREMIARENLDLVSVATYAPQHAEVTVACAGAGIRAIHCEKPMATRLTDAEHMVAGCAAAGTLLVINHNRRFNPNYRRLRELAAAGDLGTLTSVSLQWGTGRLGNVGTHLIDAALMLTGRRVEAVSGTLDRTGRPDCRGPAFRDPGGWGLLRLGAGLIVTVDAADEARVPARIVLNGTRGRAMAGGDDVTLEYWDGRHDHWPSLRQQATSMDRAVAEIVVWLDGDRPFAYPAQEALDVLEAIIAFHASDGRKGAWTQLPLVGEDRNREVQSG